MEGAVKEYGDILALAKGVIATAIAEAKDGFQVKDLFTIIGNNFAAVMTAYEGAGLIGEAWKTHADECMAMTVDFAVDAACDILKIGTSTSGSFKETSEVLAAVQGIATSVIAHLPGGFQASEILPVVMENFNTIIVGAEGAEKIGVELKGDVRGFIKLICQFVVRLVFVVKGALTPKSLT